MLTESLLKQVHPDVKNINEQTSEHSSKKILWLCDKGHEWETQIRKRAIQGHGCPYCGNKKVLTGFNDLTTTNPNIANQWNHPKNIIAPTEILAGSKQKVWWLCEKGHEWEALVRNRAKNGHNCPICTNRITRQNVNDLTTTHPDIAAQWHPTKNIFTPNKIVAGNDTKVWWKCELGHEWEARVNSRTKGKTNCPTCAGRITRSGFNDLVTLNPELFKQWHPTRNVTVNPDELTLGSGKKVWWLCEKGHEWETRVSERKRHDCPVCGTRISKAENEIYQFLTKIYDNEILTSTRSLISPFEVDFWLPEKQLAIEYNGLYWHSEIHRSNTFHYEKWKACQEKNVQLIQIWEDDWILKPEVVKQMLTYKLSLAPQKVYARNTYIESLSKIETNNFLNQHHIQGMKNGSIRVGLKTKTTKELVAVLILTQERNKTLNLERYATSVSVAGGFTKLLKHVEETHKPEKIVTFSDNTVSDGGLYANNGFTAEKQLSPDYFYIVNGKREHKFKYRLQKFKTDDNLKYIESATEKELAEINNLLRIWDAGKTKWVKNV